MVAEQPEEWFPEDYIDEEWFEDFRQMVNTTWTEREPLYVEAAKMLARHDVRYIEWLRLHGLY
jgi:hypothetical protein